MFAPSQMAGRMAGASPLPDWLLAGLAIALISTA